MSRDKKNHIEKLNKIQIDENWCKGCGICVAVCPAKILELNDRMKAVVKEDSENLCRECGLCEVYCPDFAILIVKDKEVKNARG